MIILIVFSCIDPVETDFTNSEPFPVMNSVVVAGQPIWVHISLGRGIDEEELNYIEDALVLLYEDDVLIDTLSYTSEGYYRSEFMPKQATKISLVASTTSGLVFSGETFVPSKPAFSNFQFIEIAGIDEDGYLYPAIEFTINNMSPDEEEFYEVLVLEESIGFDSLELRVQSLYQLTDPVLLSASYSDFSFGLFSNEFVRDTSYRMRLSYRVTKFPHQPGPVILCLRKVDKTYYDYFTTYYIYTDGLYPEFMEPVTPVSLPSNVKNGRGVICSYAAIFQKLNEQPTQ